MPPPDRDCRFSRSVALPVCHPERSSHFFASGVEGSTRSDFFFPARFQTNRFAAIPPRVRFGLRLAHLVGMTNKGARENRQPPRGGRTKGGKPVLSQGAERFFIKKLVFPHPARGQFQS